MAECGYHPDREPVGACISCGKLICAECKTVIKGKFYCNPCVEELFADKDQPEEEASEPVKETPAEPAKEKPVITTIYCTSCGKAMNRGASFCTGCGASVGGAGKAASRAARPKEQYYEDEDRLPIPFTGSIIAGVGVLLILISMLFDWYSLRCYSSTFDCSGHSNISFGDLFDKTDLVWVGNPFPLILMIIFASIAFLAIIYSLIRRLLAKKILRLMGTLVILSLLANFGYLLIEMVTEDTAGDYTLYIAPHVGWGMAFVGSIVLFVGSAFGGSKN